MEGKLNNGRIGYAAQSFWEAHAWVLSPWIPNTMASVKTASCDDSKKVIF
jgi:hypothetical protein